VSAKILGFVRTADFDLGRIDIRRRRIYENIISLPNTGVAVLEGSAFDELVVLSRRALRLTRRSDLPIRETLMEFADASITDRVLDRIAIKLAGGYSLLKRGRPIRHIQKLTKQLWAPLEILELRFGYVDRKNRLRLDMTAIVVAGELVGREILQALPSRFVTTTFAHALGWPRFGRPRHNSLVRTWFCGLLMQHERRGTQIAEFRCLPHQQKYNRKLKKQREEPCLMGYRQQCATCPIGYSRCVRGTHRYTWIVRACPRCHVDRAMFDPEDVNARYCIACKVKKARKLWLKERQSM